MTDKPQATYNSPVLSGKADGPVAIGGREAVDFGKSQGAIYKPSGPVEQHFGDRHYYYNAVLEDSTPGIDIARLSDLSHQYLKAITEDWAYLRVGDIRLPLTQVFFMLRAQEQLPRQLLYSVRGDLEPNSKRLAGTDSDAARTPTIRPPAPSVPLRDALRQTSHLVLLGEPGAGKSTALQFIGLSCADRDAVSSMPADRLVLAEIRYPILLTLQAVAFRLQNEEIVLKDILVGEVRQRLNCEPKEALSLVESWNGELLVLLDGLDEVPDVHRPTVRNKIENFLRSSYGQQARVVLTSRPVGFTSLAGMTEFTIQSFQDPEKEARPFLTRWLAALKKEWTQEAEIRAAELLEQMHARPAMRPVLNNLLLLRLSAETYALTGEIAPNRADLYTRHMEEMWTRAEKRGASAKQKDAALEALEALAWHLQQGGTNEETALRRVLEEKMTQKEKDTEFLLRLLREKTGLIAHLPGEQGGYVFTHQTLREYFVARHLQRAWEVNLQRTFDFLRLRLHLPEWREPLVLLAALLPEAQATDFIRRVYCTRSPYERRVRRDILLAAHLTTESGRWEAMQGLLLPDLIGVLWNLRGGESRSAVEILKNIGDPAVVPYLIFILQHGVSTERRIATEVLGEIGNLDVVDDLSAALRDECWSVRQAAVEALGKIGPAAVPNLIAVLRDEDWWGCQRAAEALGKIGDGAATLALSAALRAESKWVRRVAGEALGKICASAAVPHLSTALRGKDARVRQVAAEALGETGGPAAVSALGVALRDADADVRWAAARALGKIGDPAAVPPLIAVLRDKDADVRQVVAEALGKIGDKAAAPPLIAALRDKDTFFRQAAAEALGNIGDKTAALALIAALQDEDTNVREAARAALERCGDKATVPDLIAALRNENWRVRRGAAEALGAIGDPIAVPVLSAALQDKDQYVRKAAANALGRIGDPAAVPILRAVLRGKDKSLCLSAARALGDIGNLVAISDLIAILQHVWWARLFIEWPLTRLLSRLKPPFEPQERRAWLRRLRRLRRVVVRADLPDLLVLTLERESAIRMAASLWHDPLQPPPVPVWRVWVERIGMGVLALVLAGLIGVLVSPAQKVLEEQLLSLFQAQPLWAAAMAVGLGTVLSTLLGLALDKLRRRPK